MEKELEIRIKKLEQRLDFLSDQLNKAFIYIKDDPHSSLTKSRTILERILLNIYKLEMDQEPKRIELGAILTDNQFTRKIDKRIVSRMNAIRDMSNLGVHGEKVVSKDARIVLDNLCEVLEWYYENYKTIIADNKQIDSPLDSTRKSKKRSILFFLMLLLGIVIIVLIIINFFGSGNKNLENEAQNLKKTVAVLQLPSVTTTSVTDFTSINATVGGNIISDGGATVTDRGVYWGTTQDPETSGTKLQIGNGSGTFSTILPGLIPGTIYYIKAFAINSQGTGYGNQVSITTSENLTIPNNTISIHEKSQVTPFKETKTPNEVSYFIDPLDLEQYKTVRIGNQTWMAENLRTIEYNDGTAIDRVTDNAAWKGLITPAYCWYDNDENKFKSDYGAIYNWYTVRTGKLCPEGWHVPTDNEWKTLVMHLGMSQSEADYSGWHGTNEGGKLKETGTIHWESPNEGATNETSFMALPGGGRNSNGDFYGFGVSGEFWTATEYYVTTALYRGVSSSMAMIDKGGYDKGKGLSVRCIKD
jgi:uncharacterized protein (TIGR02145 family)